ncbi:MAG: CCA tRNA nucleotidyltransferase, partial [Pseudomonadota bacterium]
QRRDFTVNALYADRSGEVRDPVGGLPDLAERRFRFIGDAEARIREDYLRILRFFRFFAWYGEELDAEGLAACAALGEGLASLSAERVTAELLKLLSAPGPAPAVAAMEQAGLLSRVLPGASSSGLGPYVHLEPSLDPIARLAALGGDTALLKLSRDEARRLRAYGEMKGWERVSLMGYRHGADMGRRGAALRAAALERELVPKELDAVARGADAVFPVRAADLPMELEGPEIGKALNRLETAFIASDFTLSKSELLALL